MKLLAGLSLILLVGCGASAEMKPTTPVVKATRNADGTVNDQSRCEWKNRSDREASETAGPGSVQPNVRRVYQLVGSGDDRHKVLVCREIDTNFDGVKDVVRKYNDKGESLYEEADANYDGRVDTWITFSKGRLAEERVDTNRDGNPDVWKYYSGGKLSRVKRDTNFDGKADVWEIYRDDKLERMGVDVDGDEHVDRWDHDNEVRRKAEDDDRKKEEEAAAKKAAADKEQRDKDAAEEAANPTPTPAAKKEKKPAAKNKK
jgi:hypothetical protein